MLLLKALAAVLPLVAATQHSDDWYKLDGKVPRSAYFIHFDVPLFRSKETPIQVYDTARWDQMNWNCIAAMSPDYFDSLTAAEPTLRAPAEYMTSRHRVVCANFAKYEIFPVLMPNAVEAHAKSMDEWGYSAYTSDKTREDVRGCLDGPAAQKSGCLQTMLDAVIAAGGHDLNVAALFGAIVGMEIVDHMDADGYNANGRRAYGGHTCTKNCWAYSDYTGYKPVNTPEYPLVDETRWQPLEESNMYGFFYAQKHVTPQLGQAKMMTVPQSWMNKECPPPNYNYADIDTNVIDQVANLVGDDLKKTMIKFFDQKSFVFMDIGASIGWPDMSYEEFTLFRLGYTTGEYDIVNLTWKEKVRHDRIRPTSRVQAATSYNGPDTMTWHDGSTISRKDWTPYIRVMPHGEYPSGSAAICTTIKDYANAWAAGQGAGQDVKSGWKTYNAKGEASILFNTTFQYDPALFAGAASDFEKLYQFKDVDEAAHLCSESRLWGGMHYRKAVTEGINLAEGFGEQAYSWTVKLRRGQRLPGNAPGDLPVNTPCRDVRLLYRRTIRTPAGMNAAIKSCDALPECMAKKISNGNMSCSRANLVRHCKSLDEPQCSAHAKCQPNMARGAFRSCTLPKKTN